MEKRLDTFGFYDEGEGLDDEDHFPEAATGRVVYPLPATETRQPDHEEVSGT